MLTAGAPRGFSNTSKEVQRVETRVRDLFIVGLDSFNCT